MSRITGLSGCLIIVILSMAVQLAGGVPCVANVTREEVERAIREGVRYLKSQQRADGSWSDVEDEAKTGTTSLITLALLTAGEKAESPRIRQALEYLRNFGPNDLKSTYAIGAPDYGLRRRTARGRRVADRQQCFLARTSPDQTGRSSQMGGLVDVLRLEAARPGDNSNTQYALLGLHAASEAGVTVKPVVWELARAYWEKSQKASGGWAYTPDSANQTASMTCAGVSSLIITGLRRFQGQEFLEGETIQDCGKGGINPKLQAGINWLADHFQVSQNFGNGQQWKFYYLYGLERAGRLAGMRFFGRHDWYRLGPKNWFMNRISSADTGKGAQRVGQGLGDELRVFVSRQGGAPVLINKLVHLPSGDWNNDPDDIRNIVNVVSREWKNLLTWQVVDPGAASLPELLQAPIIFFNGHQAPQFSAVAKQNLRDSIEQGAFLFAEACCSSKEFDQGFKQLMTEIFPEPEYKLRPLSEEHPVWREAPALSRDPSALGN